MRVSSLPWRMLAFFVVWLVVGFLFFELNLHMLRPSIERALRMVLSLQQATSPRLIVIGGSTALHGIATASLSKNIGRFTWNGATEHESYNHANPLNLALSVAKPGDIVIYQSPALLGYNENWKIRDAEANYFAVGVGLPPPAPSPLTTLMHTFRWAPLPSTSVAAWIYQASKRANDAGATDYDGVAQPTQLCPDEAQPITRQPHLDGAYFALLARFQRSMLEREVHVIYVPPTLYVAAENLAAWTSILGNARQRLTRLGGSFIAPSSTILFPQDSSLFCDALHVKPLVAQTQTRYLLNELRKLPEVDAPGKNAHQ